MTDDVSRQYLYALRHWSSEAVTATVARDRLIRALRAQGATLREIAEASGLSEMAISKKCRGLVRGSAAQREDGDADEDEQGE